MAEYNIMDVAGLFTIDKYRPHSWICRDDNDDYWTVIRDTDGNLRVYKSTDDGQNWTLKKTLTNDDFTNDNPFPTDWFQIINLKGQDKVYLFIRPGDTSSYLCDGWIFNVTADTNIKDMDGVNLATTLYCKRQWGCHADWNYFTLKLLLYGTRDYLVGEMRFSTINLNGTLSNSYVEGYGGRFLGLHIDPDTGNCFKLGENIGADELLITKNNTTVSFAVTKANIRFANIICGYDSHPVVGYAYNDSGTEKLIITKRDKDNLSSELISVSYNISSNVAPISCFMSVDGVNNIYFIWTDGDDLEAYYIKYNIVTLSWGTPTKISSDNNGELAMIEMRPPITDNKILVIYSSLI